MDPGESTGDDADERRWRDGALAANRSQVPGASLWLAVGAAALFGLIFSVGAIAGGAGTSSSASSASSAPSGTAIEQQTINTIRTVDPSVVQVQAQGSRGSGVGSGEILTTSGYIVTNDHVVCGLSSLRVLLADGRQVAARLVGEAPTEDLAVLKISTSNLKPIAVGDSSKAQVGEYALAIAPLGWSSRQRLTSSAR